jgi:RNA recognition motif-containing protein
MESRKVFAANVPPEATTGEIMAYFGQCGEVLDVYRPKDKQTGRFRTYVFIEMGSHQEAATAIEKLNGKHFPDLPPMRHPMFLEMARLREHRRYSHGKDQAADAES